MGGRVVKSLTTCTACSRYVAEQLLCEHDDTAEGPICPGCCAADHEDPPRMWRAS